MKECGRSQPLVALMLLAVSFVAGGTSSVAGEEPPRQVTATPRVDLYGDPLPPGAVARLGTVQGRHSGRIHSIAFARDGKTLVTAGEEGRICFWDVVTGRCQERQLGDYEVRAIAFSEDGTTLASVNLDGGVKLWNTTTGQVVWSAEGKRWFSTSVAVSPDGKRLASGGRDGNIRIWDVGNDREPLAYRRYKTGGGGAAYVTFSKNGKNLIAACSDGSIRTWDTVSSRESSQWHYAPEISAFALSPDGRTVAVAAQNSRATHLKDVATGKDVRAFPLQANCLAFSPDGTIVGMGGGGMLGLWGTRTGKQIHQWGGQSGIQTLAFSPDGKRVAAAGEMNRIHIWDLATRRDLHPDRGHDESAVGAVFSPDGNTVASTSHDRTIRFWEAASGRQIKRLNAGDQPINRIAFSADGKILAGSWFFDAFRVWSVKTGQELSTIKAPDGLYSVLSLSPDGKTLAAGTKEPPNLGMPMEQDCLIRVWNQATGKKLRQFQVGRGYTNDLFFSHDGGTLVARTGQVLFGGRPAGIYVWELASGKLKRRFVEGEKSFHGIAVSPDGRQLLTGYVGDRVRLWDIDTGKVLRQFGEREMDVYRATFSPDGKLVMGLNVGKECIHVWNAATGEEFERFGGHRGSINSISVSSDGKFLASTGEDTSVLIWDLSRANKRAQAITR